jgi:hypothetical protein
MGIIKGIFSLPGNIVKGAAYASLGVAQGAAIGLKAVRAAEADHAGHKGYARAIINRAEHTYDEDDFLLFMEGYENAKAHLDDLDDQPQQKALPPKPKRTKIVQTIEGDVTSIDYGDDD